MKAFISYSSKDLAAAVKLTEHLTLYGIPYFMADYSLRVSDVWKTRIQKELGTSAVLIALLSKHFNKSNWTSQEIGLFISKSGRLVIPLSLDGTKPFGFISHLHSRQAVPDRLMPTELVIAPILNHYPVEMASLLIDKLIASNWCRWSEQLMKLLQPYYGKLPKSLVVKLMDGAISNNSIHAAYDCRQIYLADFVKINRKAITVSRIKKLQAAFDKDPHTKSTDLLQVKA